MDVRVGGAVAGGVVVAGSREEGWWGSGGGILERVVPAFDGETRVHRVDGRVYMDVCGSRYCWVELIRGSFVASWMSLFMVVDC